MATTMPLPDQMICLIIRFAASIPDLEILVSPHTTTTLSLKQLIRLQLPLSHGTARLRLIYAGKVLPDTAPLSVSLRLPPPPPPRDGAYSEHGPGSKSKGKQPVRDETTESTSSASTSAPAPPPPKRFYIHCSLGDSLSAKELISEVYQAEASEASLHRRYEPSSSTQRRSSITSSEHAGPSSETTTTTTPAPQGFDRLLTSGFTPQEVSTLRSQFQTNLSYTHTPDTMPSAAEMRALEDRWLDSTGNADPSPALAGGGDGADTGWGAGFSAEEGGLDDMFYGYLTGFFWPLGALIWGFREEGVWSRRRQVAVVMGVVLNAAFGFMRWSS